MQLACRWRLRSALRADREPFSIDSLAIEYRQLLHKLLPADWPPLFQSPPASAGMAGDGELRRLFQTFMKLKRSCQHAEVNFNSDCDGVCQVVLRVTTPGTGFQSPSGGGAQSRSQERKGSGAQNLPTPPTVTVPALAPGPAPAHAPGPAPKRARRRGPGALLRDERRRLARIEPEQANEGFTPSISAPQYYLR